MKRACSALLAAFVAIAGGCTMTAETYHSLYLDPDGTVTWSVVERNVRSESDDPHQRESDEQEWLAELDGGRNPVALALAQLGATSVETQLLRRERPFNALTEATFTAIDDLARAIGDGLCVETRARLTREGSQHRLEIEIDFVEEELECDEAGTLLPLWDALEELTIHLTKGAFTEAQGFTLDRTAAVATIDQLSDEPGTERLVLAWEEGK